MLYTPTSAGGGGVAVGRPQAAYQPTNNLGCQLEGQLEMSMSIGGYGVQDQNFSV